MRPMLKLLTVAALGAAPAVLAADGTITGKVDVTPGKYLEETVVYLKGVKAPSGKGPESKSMDQKAMTFIPHVLVVSQGDTVKFLNHDNVVHNVYSPDNEATTSGRSSRTRSGVTSSNKRGRTRSFARCIPRCWPTSSSPRARTQRPSTRRGTSPSPTSRPAPTQLAVWNSHLKTPDKPVTVGSGETVTQNLALKR